MGRCRGESLSGYWGGRWEANCSFVLFYPSQFRPITHSFVLPSAPSSTLQKISFLVLSSSNLPLTWWEFSFLRSLLFTLQKNLWNMLPADSPSAITRYLSLFKYLYFHFGGVLVTIKSSVPNLPSLNQTFINSLDRSSARFHGWNPGSLMHFSYTIGSFKLGQDEEGREERKW